MEKQDYTYYAFISYSRKDMAFAKEIKNEVERITGQVCWMDMTGIQTGEQFEESIISAIDNSRYLILLLSESSMQSVYVKKEVTYADLVEKKILPINIDGCSPKGWYLFNFGRIDTIDYNIEDQKNKFYSNLKSWSNETGASESNPEVPNYQSEKTLFIELAKSLNDLYISSSLVYSNFPYIDQNKIYEIMKHPCEGEYKNVVQDLANAIEKLASVLYKIVQDADTLRAYTQKLQEVESKVLRLYPDKNMLDMNSLIDVANLLNVVQKILQKPTMERLITAKLATNVGKGLEYNNANIRSLFLTGNIICNEIVSTHVNNIGAAILHDLFMILPDACKRLVTPYYGQALFNADQIGDLYHIELK